MPFPVLTPPGPNEPFYYAVASNLHHLCGFPREHHLAIWRHVLDVYAEASQEVPAALRDLCHPEFVETLMGNDVFWGLAGVQLGRSSYAEASHYLPAIYATAALLACQNDAIQIHPEAVARVRASFPSPDPKR